MFQNSHVEYGLLNWSTALSTILDDVRISMKKAIRLITSINKKEHANPLFKELDILPFDVLVTHKQACFMWRLTNKI